MIGAGDYAALYQNGVQEPTVGVGSQFLADIGDGDLAAVVPELKDDRRIALDERRIALHERMIALDERMIALDTRMIALNERMIVPRTGWMDDESGGGDRLALKGWDPSQAYRKQFLVELLWGKYILLRP